jgi:hypothetical protein
MKWPPKIKIPKIKIPLPTLCKTVKARRLKFDATSLKRLRMDLVRDLTIKPGWAANDCDAMLWQAKLDAVTGRTELILQAEGSPGRFFRRASRDCYSKRLSKSSWSRDMAVGFFWWIWRTKSLDAAYRHLNYGRKKLWKMGTGPLARVQYTPQLIGLFHKIINKVGGRNFNEAKIPYVWPTGLVDYEAHLQCLVMALIGEMNGKIPEPAFRRLNGHYERERRNPLYAVLHTIYTGKHISETVEVCHNPKFDSYVRGPEKARQIELLFAVDLLLRAVD